MTNNRIRPVRALLLFTGVVFIGGALLAPMLYWLVQSLGTGSRFTAWLARQPFRRYVDRSFLVLALLGIWPLLRSLGARSAAEVGLVHPARQGRRLGAGLLLGFGSLAVVAILSLALHGRAWNGSLTPGKLASGLGSAALAACVVAVLEELLFRGAIFGALRRCWHWRTALLLSSMIYAIVHFMGPADYPGPVTWSSGLEMLPMKLSGFADWHTVVPGFFNLTLAGCLLGLGYQRTGNLYFSIGLHAGWIFWLKSYALLMEPGVNNAPWFFGTNKLIDGWLALVVLALVVPVLLRILPVNAKPSPP